MLTILFDGVAYGMLLFILAVGLAVTMGLMNFINLAHGAFERLGVFTVMHAKLRVAMCLLLTVLLNVLLPQQHQRHALATQLLVDEPVIGQDKAALRGNTADQPLMQLRLVHGLNLFPAQARGTGQARVLGDDALGDAQGDGYSFIGEIAYVFETQNVLDIAH